MERWKQILIVSGAILCVGVLIAIVVAAAGSVVSFFAAIAVYIIIALVLVLISRPILNLLDRVKIRNWQLPASLKAIFTLLILVGILVGIAIFFVPLVAEISNQVESIDASSLSAQLKEPLDNLEEMNAAYGFMTIDEGNTFEEQILSDIRSLIDQVNFSDLVSNVLGLAGNFFIGAFSTIFITFYFMRERDLLSDLILRITPDKYDPAVIEVMENINSLLTRYLVGVLLEILLVGGLIALGLSILGVPNALFIGYFAGIFNVIPYLGPIIGGVMTGAMTFLFAMHMDFYDYTIPLVIKALSVFLVVQLIDNFVFQPLIYSSSVKAHPLEIFLVILMAANLAGPAGMIVAVPTYTIIRVIAREIYEQFRSNGNLHSSETYASSS